MKLTKYLVGIMAAGLMASCSSDDVVEPVPAPVAEGGDGYISLSLNLPTTPASRANDVFDDGLPREYNVKDAAILLFMGESESAATLESSYEIYNGSDKLWNVEAPDVDNDNITTSYKKIMKIEVPGNLKTSNLYVLVVVNSDGVVKANNGVGVLVNGAAFSGTFADLLKVTSKAELIKNEGSPENQTIFMTNAPLATVAGTNASPAAAEICTLVNMTAKVYATEAEAKAADAVGIYVERALAKATIVNSASTIDVEGWEGVVESQDEYGKITANGDKPVVKHVRWTLSNVEDESFIVRNFDSTWLPYQVTDAAAGQYRFVGNARVGYTSIQPYQDLFRTYFCKDPNYGQDKTYEPLMSAYNSATNLYDVEAMPWSETGTENPQYCRENTFDVAHQNYKNTTRAILEVTVDAGIGVNEEDGTYKDFYLINGRQTMVYSEETAKSFVKKYVVENSDVIDAVERAVKNNALDGKYNVADYVVINYAKERDEKGILKVVGVEFTTLVGGDQSTMPKFLDGQEAELVKNVNSYYVLEQYKKGICYYDARIKHFGDDLSPAPVLEGTVLDTEAAYKGNADRYLGRFGMVRNNWYEINVSSYKRFGSPVVPDANVETSDDNNVDEQWLSFTVNILSWAKRVQNFEF